MSDESLRLKITGAIQEEARGGAYHVVMVAAGNSLNLEESRPIHYSLDLITRDHTAFEGQPTRAIKLGDEFGHTPDGINKAILTGNIIGVMEKTRIEDGQAVATLVLHEGARKFYGGLFDLSIARVKAGGQPLVGLSIDGPN